MGALLTYRKIGLTLPCLVLSGAALAAPLPPVRPLLGAQIWIEPGQTPEQIDGWFRTLAEPGMPVTRPFLIWIDGAETVIDNESEFQARHSRIFDPGVKKGVAESRVETLVANQQGVGFDNGRVRLRPQPQHKNARNIVAINDPNRTR